MPQGSDTLSRMNRPTLIPGLPRTWRSPVELQLGSDPARAVVLHLSDPRMARLLDLLDGTRAEQTVKLHAASLGIAPADVHALLQTLHTAGLVLPAGELVPVTLTETIRRRLAGEAAALALHRPPPADSPATTLRRRGLARVVITGRGRLGAGIAVALAEAGVGHVHPDLPGLVGAGELAGGPLRESNVGQLRQEAVAAAIEQAAPTTQTHGVRRLPACLVVQLEPERPINLVAAAFAARRQPHLTVAVREGVAVIGPLVSATGRPCLNCLHLHRRERDAAWPSPSRPDAAEPGAVTTLLAATALAAAEVLSFLDEGVTKTLGASIEISHSGQVRRRTWQAHPHCPCAAMSRTDRANQAELLPRLSDLSPALLPNTVDPGCCPRILRSQ